MSGAPARRGALRLALCAWLLAVAALAIPLAAAASPEPEAAAPTLFQARIAPLLAGSCLRCHGPARQKGYLRVDSRAALVLGGGRGPALIPGQPDRSLLMTAVRYGDDDLQMPPDRQLDPPQISDLAAWIAAGAPWDGDLPAAHGQSSAAAAAAAGGAGAGRPQAATALASPAPRDAGGTLTAAGATSWEAGRPFLGKLHLLVLHVPIVALALALLAEALVLIRGPSWDATMRLLLLIGTAGAIAAVVTGSVFTDEGTLFHRGGDRPLMLHERAAWVAMLTASTASLLLLALPAAGRPRLRWTFRCVLGAGAALAGLAAHLGGEMKYGAHWLF
jgi:mono/diheme cytochrome c family protein